MPCHHALDFDSGEQTAAKKVIAWRCQPSSVPCIRTNQSLAETIDGSHLVVRPGDFHKPLFHFRVS